MYRFICKHRKQKGTIMNNTNSKSPLLDIRSLVLLAVLLAAGFILNFTLGRLISALTGGLISPEFIIAAYCLTILLARPNILQALIVGLISAAVIQITTTSPGIDFVADGVAAMAMVLFVTLLDHGPISKIMPVVTTFFTTVLSGVIFMLIKMLLVGASVQLAQVMLPVIVLTACFNAILVQALYVPLSKTFRA